MSYPPTASLARGLLPPGSRLNDHYEIDAFLKSGGMGDVYKGHEIETGDLVAIKVIRDDMAGDDVVLQMFRKEALALRRIHHEAVVRYFGFTLEPHLRRHYIAMEFVEGTPLSDLLERGPLPVEQVLALMRRLALGLQAAHEHDVVHRDVSPDNIIVPQSGIHLSRLIDFGIARSLLVGDATIIGSGFAGKHKYVSPEQLGLYGGDVRAASDIYSLGLVLAQCLRGKPLDMDGTQVEVIEKRRGVPDLSGVDARIRPMLARMLQPDPAKRPGSMAEIAAWSPASPGSSDAATMIAPPAGAARRKPQPVAKLPPTPAKAGGGARGRAGAILQPSLLLAAAAIVLLSGAGYWSWSRIWPKPKQSPPAIMAEPAEPPTASSQTDPFVRVREFTRDFDGGDCFLAVAGKISAEAVEVEGFGRAQEPFDALDKAFPDAIGLHAAIGVHKIAAPQCPALAFAKRFLDTEGLLNITLVRNHLRRSGDTLEGSVETQARDVQLLIVDDDGLVNNITSLLGAQPERRDFAMELRASRAGPVLLLAVAGAKPIKARQPLLAKEMFASLSGDAAAASSAPTVAIRFLQLTP